jgi:fumarate hydratase class II
VASVVVSKKKTMTTTSRAFNAQRHEGKASGIRRLTGGASRGLAAAAARTCASIRALASGDRTGFGISCSL